MELNESESLFSIFHPASDGKENFHISEFFPTPAKFAHSAGAGELLTKGPKPNIMIGRVMVTVKCKKKLWVDKTEGGGFRFAGNFTRYNVI